MNINKHNIHDYIKLYTSGLLNETEIQKLFEYIESHINEVDIDTLNIFQLPGFSYLNTMSFDNKQKLYKPDESKFIEYIEDIMPFDEKQDFEKLIQQDILLQKELTTFQYTVLKPDFSITFPYKNKLKKNKYIVNYKSIAASILLLFVLLFTLYYIIPIPKNNTYLVKEKKHLNLKNKQNINHDTQNPTLAETKSNTLQKSLHHKPFLQKTNTNQLRIKKNHTNEITIPPQNQISPSTFIDSSIIKSPDFLSKDITIIDSTILYTGKNSTLITSLDEIQKMENSDVKQDSTPTFIKKIFYFFRKNKIIVNTDKSLVISKGEKELFTLHIPQIEFKNKETVTFEPSHSSY